LNEERLRVQEADSRLLHTTADIKGF